MTEADLQKWLDSGEYLPEFMRDFHAQKDLFRYFNEVIRQRVKDRPDDDLAHVPFGLEGIYHVYTVDVFLWVMAKHGYTLQKSRKRLPFGNIQERVHQTTDRIRTSAVSLFKMMLSKASPPGDPRDDA